MKCYICDNHANERLAKKGVLYYQCSNCKTLFCGDLDNSDKVGGEYEVERNRKENHLRVTRVDEMILGIPKGDVKILDFGAGHGYLIEDLKSAGYHADGYDAYNEKYQKLPQRDTYNIVTCVECIEHTSQPYVEIDVMYRVLKNGGAVMIETSFVDIANIEGIPLEEFFYINPDAGHSTIFSHHGLDLLMVKKGFQVFQHFDRNVRIYVKR